MAQWRNQCTAWRSSKSRSHTLNVPDHQACQNQRNGAGSAAGAHALVLSLSLSQCAGSYSSMSPCSALGVNMDAQQLQTSPKQHMQF
jgi:hypothetical protein